MAMGLRKLWFDAATEVTEIHVYCVILQSSRDKNACTRSVTKAGPMSDPVQRRWDKSSKSGGTWKLKSMISLGNSLR